MLCAPEYSWSCDYLQAPRDEEAAGGSQGEAEPARGGMGADGGESSGRASNSDPEPRSRPESEPQQLLTPPSPRQHCT